MEETNSGNNPAAPCVQKPSSAPNGTALIDGTTATLATKASAEELTLQPYPHEKIWLKESSIRKVQVG